MAGRRFMIDLFVEESVYDSIPTAKKLAFRDTIRGLKTFALVKEGVELTATWHVCCHDTIPAKPCGDSQDI